MVRNKDVILRTKGNESTETSGALRLTVGHVRHAEWLRISLNIESVEMCPQIGPLVSRNRGEQSSSLGISRGVDLRMCCTVRCLVGCQKHLVGRAVVPGVAFDSAGTGGHN